MLSLGLLNLGWATAIILWFLFCADTVERERLAHHTPAPTYVSFHIYFYWLCFSACMIALLDIRTAAVAPELTHFLSQVLLVLSWIMLWIHHHLRIAFGLGVASLLVAGFHMISYAGTEHLYFLWVSFLMLHNWATFRFAQDHYLTRLGSRSTSRIENPGKRPNADVFILPTQNEHLLAAETKEEQLLKMEEQRRQMNAGV
jgi:hypothetical protein